MFKHQDCSLGPKIMVGQVLGVQMVKGLSMESKVTGQECP